MVKLSVPFSLIGLAAVGVSPVVASERSMPLMPHDITGQREGVQAVGKLHQVPTLSELHSTDTADQTRFFQVSEPEPDEFSPELPTHFSP